MQTPEDADTTAAELALGVLDGEERAAATRRVLAEPAFARDVERWRGHFAALFAAWPEAEPAPGMARQVAAASDARAGAGPWRLLAIAAGVAAGLLLGVLLLRPGPAPVAPPVPSAPRLLAVFAPTNGAPFGAVVDQTLREVRLSGTVAVPPGRAAELWAIGADGVPHAAGLLAGRSRQTLALPSNIETAAGVTLAVSIEPAGGSPRATPTGPVVASGKLTEL